MRPQAFVYRGRRYEPALKFAEGGERLRQQLGGHMPVPQAVDKHGHRLYVMPGGRWATAQTIREIIQYQERKTQ